MQPEIKVINLIQEVDDIRDFKEIVDKWRDGRYDIHYRVWPYRTVEHKRIHGEDVEIRWVDVMLEITVIHRDGHIIKYTDSTERIMELNGQRVNEKINKFYDFVVEWFPNATKGRWKYN